MSLRVAAMADDLDHVLNDSPGFKALRWHLEAWRTGIPYQQIVLRHHFRFSVEHLFLIHTASGIVLTHLSSSSARSLDPDAVGGMFIAINQFVRDSVFAHETTIGIASATVGDYRLTASNGPRASLVALIRGVPPRSLILRMQDLLDELHRIHGRLLEARPENIVGNEFLTQGTLEELNELRQTSWLG